MIALQNILIFLGGALISALVFFACTSGGANAQTEPALKGSVKEQQIQSTGKPAGSTYSLHRTDVLDPFHPAAPAARTKANPNDQFSPLSDEEKKSPQLKLAWDAWHSRLAKVIYQRYQDLSAGLFVDSKPLSARVSYVVTRDGRITNIQLPERSGDRTFDDLVYQVVRSLDGDRELLAYPPGSARQSVEKTATFTQNFGQEGFSYTTGDQEKVGKGK